MPEGIVRVGVVEKNQNPYWDMVNAGWTDAAERLGMELRFRAPEQEDASAQADLVGTLLDEGVDAIALVGTSDSAFDEVCDRARERGVVVVTFDLDASRDRRSLFVGMTDPETIGRQVGERIAAEVGPGALVLLQSGSATARGAVGKLRGLLAALSAAGVATEVSPPDGEDAETAAAHADALFAAHPEASAAIGVYGYHPSVLAAAATRAGSEARIHGFDMLPETVELLQSGAIASSVWIREYFFGYLTAVAVHDLVTLGSEDVLTLYGGVADGAGRSIELTPRVFTPADVHEFVDWRDSRPSLQRTFAASIP